MSTEVKSSAPSSNWLALQKKLPTTSHVKKKRKIDGLGRYMATMGDESSSTAEASTSFVRGHQKAAPAPSVPQTTMSLPDMKNGESRKALQKMVTGEQTYSASQEQPGTYLALDCEMVGVGIDGKESSLARVSLVNYHGAVQMDEFVKQRERVVDYRTQYSGVRPSDMINAKPFNDIQQRVSDLLKDRILVGHAVHNDLKVLLLSHPRHQTRDTQFLASKHKLTKSKRPALRNLVQQELGMAIQQGEHSSVIDARATMALYRLHKKEWETGFRHHVTKKRPRSSSLAPAGDGDIADEHHDDQDGEKKARVREGEKAGEGVGEDDEPEDDSQVVPSTSKNTLPVIERKSQTQSQRTSKEVKRAKSFPGGGQKGISSGLSTVVKTHGQTRIVQGHRGAATLKSPSSSSSSNAAKSKTKSQWWKQLGNSPSSSSGVGSGGGRDVRSSTGNSSGSKGSLRLRVG